MPLAEIFGSADSPGKWVAKERSGHSAAYQVRLARLDPRWCPFVDAGMGANGPGNPGMKPCLGGELYE